MLAVSKRGLSNFRHSKHAAFQNNVSCLCLMAAGLYLTDAQRSTLLPIAKLSKEKPEALRGIGGVIRQFLRQLNKQVLAGKAG